MKINLETRNKQDEILLKYLEENASESLADKINNGITIEKDGKSLISKKDLKGFMSYANDEAKKLAEKGATSAMVEDSVVFGWLMHYFEEDSIEGTLFNPDGKPYQPPKKTPTKTTTTPTIKKVEKKPEQQYSLFDMLTKNEEPVVKKFEEDDEIKTSSTLSFKGQIAKKSQPDPLFDEDTEDDEDDVDIPSEEEIQEIMAQLHEEELAKNKVETPKPTQTVQESQKHWINDYTYVDEDGVMHEISKPSIDIPKFLIDVFTNKITAR